MRKLLSKLGTALTVFGMKPGPARTEEPNDAKSSPIALAMLALGDSTLPAPAAVLAYIEEHWPDLPALKAAAGESGELSFETDEGYIVYAGLIDAPIPAGELEFPCATNIAWEDASEAAGKIQAHVIVTTLPKDNQPIKAHVYNTVMVQAVSALSDSIGVYWGEGSNFWSPGQFADGALTASFDDPPHWLWVGQKINADEGGTFSFYTLGLSPFGSADVEVQHTRADPRYAFETIEFVSHYLALKGPVIKDGDTVGRTAEEKITVSVGPSIIEPEKQVYRLTF